MIEHYKILSDKTMAGLQDEVNKYINKGYTPFGNLVILKFHNAVSAENFAFYQPVIKKS